MQSLEKVIHYVDLKFFELHITVTIYLWTTDDEFAGRLEMVDGLGVEILMRHDGFDDMFHQVRTQLVDTDLLRVLHGDDDRVHTQWNAGAFLHPVLTRHLNTGTAKSPILQQGHCESANPAKATAVSQCGERLSKYHTRRPIF